MDSQQAMKIERIRVENFRALSDVDLKNLPKLAVFVGENGTGKSTLFQVFGFLKDALKNNVRTALAHLGGYDEVITRDCDKDYILIEIKFRMNISQSQRLVTYHLKIGKNQDSGHPVVLEEILSYRRGSYGQPFYFLNFKEGDGYAITNEEQYEGEEASDEEKQILDSPDILAIKGVGQFQRFKAASAFRNLIENWHVSDFHITDARKPVDTGAAEHLSETGDNLPLVTQYLYSDKPEVFNRIIDKFRERVPGMSNVTTHETQDGRVVLKFKDERFENPFIARYVSDGTIKMFAYLVLLYDPKPHPFLCVEEPENQLYPELMEFLVEELRDYAQKGGQVFVSTHSPELFNYVQPEEAFLMKKDDGVTKIYPLDENERIRELVKNGDQLGWLWNQGALSQLVK